MVMDIKKIKESISTVKQVIDKSEIEPKTDNNKSVFCTFCSLTNNLYDFINDDTNVAVLERYVKKDKEECPLDTLCKEVCLGLEIVVTKMGEEFTQILDKSNSSDENIVIRSDGIFALSVINAEATKVRIIELLECLDILKYLEGHNRTLIILGPNGSGKTSLANYLRQLDRRVKVIPAAKPIKASGSIPNMYNSTVDMYNRSLYENNDIEQNILQRLIIGMCSEHDDIARNHHESGIVEKRSLYEQTKEIFDKFFEVKLDSSRFSSKEIVVRKNNGEPYGFNAMSDGERTAFFYIATVVSAPSNSFIIVDEPENHLNPAIYNRIWDELIEQRKDCQFIFISHTIEFIAARNDYELVKIKEFVYPSGFVFDFLGDAIEEVPITYVSEIVGSIRPILFCEGTKSNYDYKVYASIFGNQYTVIPVGDCITVKNCVATCNILARQYSIQKAVGIIDSDLREEEEILELQNIGVVVLGCNEIELLLIDSNIFQAVLERVYKPCDLFEEFKKEFFNRMANRKQFIIKRLVKTRIDYLLKSMQVNDKNCTSKEEIEESFKDVIGGVRVDSLWRLCEDAIDKSIRNQDYDLARKYCCLEHKELIPGITNRYVDDYSSIALGVIKDNAELVNIIKEKYFSGLLKVGS